MVLTAISVLGLLLLLTTTCQSQEETRNVVPVAVEEALDSNEVPKQLVSRDKYLRQAYTDVFALLSEKNTCSAFYGGSLAATTVLNKLIRVVKRRDLPQEISVEMSGNTQQFRDADAGVTYRLFENAIVNTRGSFYQHPIDHWQRLPHEIGSFTSGSRSARALILLHELGHMIKASNGAWLIADDAGDAWQSGENTRRIQKVCLQNLRMLQ